MAHGHQYENYYDNLEGPEEESFYRPQRQVVPSPPSSLTTERDCPHLIHRPEGHTADAFSRLLEMRSKNKLCDVVITAGDLTLNAHRLVLAACSPYFSAMFSGGMKESKQGIVKFQTFSPKAIEALVDFCYLATITVTMDNVQDLLPAASLLQMYSVVGSCCIFLASQLHPSNCLGIRTFSQLHSCPELYKKCCMFMQQRFPEIALHEEFLELSFEDLCVVLSDSNLNVRGEEQVYESGLAWIKHRLEERKHRIADLLVCVRMPLMSAMYLSREVHSETLVMNNFSGRGLLIEAMDYHLRKHYMRDSNSTQVSLNTTPRHCPGLEYLFAIGGSGPPVFENDPYLDLCECYDVDKDEWRQVASMNTRRSGLRVASVGGYLFAVGGFSAVDTKALAVVDRYDPMTDSWRLVSPMNCCRRSFGIATLNGFIYAIGGITCGRYHDSVEKYCPRTNRWTFVQPMGVERRAVCVASLDGHVYAAGGHDGDGLLDTVERYDPQRDTWTVVTHLSSPCCLGSLVTLGGKLFAVGGYDGANVLQTLQCYDPHSNEWQSNAPLPIQRSGFSSAVVDGHLYLVGGCNNLSKVSTVDKYDPENDKWSSVAKMSVRRSGLGVGVAPAFLF